MSEDAAIYQLDAAEHQYRADALEDLYRRLSVEVNAARIRIRELEDAVIVHESATSRPTVADRALWRTLEDMWT